MKLKLIGRSEFLTLKNYKLACFKYNYDSYYQFPQYII